MEGNPLAFQTQSIEATLRLTFAGLIYVGSFGASSKHSGDTPLVNRFRFCVREVRAGEAKLRGRAAGERNAPV
eukprot:3121761-Pyramimonas_sp.AAC.1